MKCGTGIFGVWSQAHIIMDSCEFPFKQIALDNVTATCISAAELMGTGFAIYNFGCVTAGTLLLFFYLSSFVKNIRCARFQLNSDPTIWVPFCATPFTIYSFG